jgi:hypothetical protein
MQSHHLELCETQVVMQIVLADEAESLRCQVTISGDMYSLAGGDTNSTNDKYVGGRTYVDMMRGKLA